MSILDVQHQPWAQCMVQQALRSGRVPHAYVFHGPEGVGKGTLADRLARVLVCAAPQEIEPAGASAAGAECTPYYDACQSCDDCRLAAAGTHPDIVGVHRELNRYHPEEAVRKRKAVSLSVDVIRYFLIEPAASKPTRGRAKVFVIHEAQRMTTAAQNALLKTLEEPPGTTFLILLTRALDRLLPTTQSRCQPVPFRPLPAEFVIDQLHAQRPGLSTPAARFLGRFAEGSIGAALQACDDDFYETKTALGRRLAASSRTDGLDLAGELLKIGKALSERAKPRFPDASDTELTRVGLRAAIALAAEFYRDALRLAVGCDNGDRIINSDQSEVVNALAHRVGARGAADAIQQLTAAEENMSRNANAQLTIEAMTIALCRAGAQPVHRDLRRFSC